MQGKVGNITKKSLRLSDFLWLEWVDSNHRPPPYQGGALTCWATFHYLVVNTKVFMLGGGRPPYVLRLRYERFAQGVAQNAEMHSIIQNALL